MSTLKNIKNDSTIRHLISQIENSHSSKLRARYANDLITRTHYLTLKIYFAEQSRRSDLWKGLESNHE